MAQNNQSDPMGGASDAEQIVLRLSSLDFAWDIERALEFALFRTFAVPSISGLLHKTGTFRNETRKRYDDTEILISEVVENGFESDRAHQAISRINAMHSAYRISNGDMLYVLSTFVFEPIRWIERFGYRALTSEEKQALYAFYRQLGERMGIHDIPENAEEFEAFNRAYESAHFKFSESNVAVAKPTMDLMLGFYIPRFMWPMGRPVLRAMMDPPLLKAMGFKPAPRLVVGLVMFGLRARRWGLSWLPKRKRPHFISRVSRPTYPVGYRIDELGTFPGCPVHRQSSNG